MEIFGAMLECSVSVRQMCSRNLSFPYSYGKMQRILQVSEERAVEILTTDLIDNFSRNYNWGHRSGIHRAPCSTNQYLFFQSEPRLFNSFVCHGPLATPGEVCSQVVRLKVNLQLRSDRKNILLNVLKSFC